MSNPQEMAEQGFALLREALAASEQNGVDAANAASSQVEAAATAPNIDHDEQLEKVEAELREEKARTARLNDMLEERREWVHSLDQRLGAAETRYEEAHAKLAAAKRFERLFQRRTQLTSVLIDQLRTKKNNNQALKAGIDEFRRAKTQAETRQHELLDEIDRLRGPHGDATAHELEPASITDELTVAKILSESEPEAEIEVEAQANAEAEAEAEIGTESEAEASQLTPLPAGDDQPNTSHPGSSTAFQEPTIVDRFLDPDASDGKAERSVVLVETALDMHQVG